MSNEMKLILNLTSDKERGSDDGKEFHIVPYREWESRSEFALSADTNSAIRMYLAFECN